jgi:hypothetical protein
MARYKRIVAGIVLMAACVQTLAGNTIVVRDAWVRESPPGAPVLAAYFSLENTGSKADKLVAVRCPDFENVEIHATEIHDGMARMIALDTLTIPPHAIVKLAPGGNHLMLHHPRHAMVAGMNVKLELHFESGTGLTLLTPVRRAESGAAQ